MQQRILVIEDNPADAAIIHIYFEEASFGHVIFQADSLKRGFEILNDNAIDLVLLDLSLTDSLGFSTLEKFLAAFPQVPVIVMTGLNNDIVGVQCVRAGAQDFLVKGEFDSKGLVKSIRHSMQRFQTQTKLRESAQKLSVQQQRIREAQELAQFANWEMDMVTNVMKWGNEMYRIFGMQSHAASMSLSDYLNFVYFDDKEKVEGFFTDSMQDDEIHRIEHRIVVGNRVKYISVRAKVQFDDTSGHLLLIGSAQDISDQVSPYHLPSGYKEIPGLWNRDLLTELGNQIQKPLFDALSMAHLLHKTATPTQTELLLDFRYSLDELWSSVNNLLSTQSAFSGGLTAENVPFDAPSFLQHFSEMTEAKIRKSGVDFQFEVAPDMPQTITGDEKKFLQICFTLLKCAINDGTRTPSLKVRCAVSKEKDGHALLHLKYVPGAKFVSVDLLRVILESADLSQVAEPVLRAKATELAICGQLIRAVGGRYAISADKGLCEAFDVWFPIQIKAQSTQSPQENGGIPSSLRILLVDDHALHRIAGRSVLAGLATGITVELSENSSSATSMLAQQNFDLIFVDLQMPEMDGYATLAALQQYTDAPIIAVSPSPNPEEEARCTTSGFRGYTGKPMQADALEQEIRKALQTR